MESGNEGRCRRELLRLVPLFPFTLFGIQLGKDCGGGINGHLILFQPSRDLPHLLGRQAFNRGFNFSYSAHDQRTLYQISANCISQIEGTQPGNERPGYLPPFGIKGNGNFLVPKLHLGTQLSAQLRCSGNLRPTIALPLVPRVWERGGGNTDSGELLSATLARTRGQVALQGHFPQSLRFYLCLIHGW